ncbi:hypothetical protein ACH5RR_031184 [Cinchona calisaya]|uniref:F-box domain-containing protein n=1 Tax=Cinchona calisaya TaxID=153742 RepID=A0ABD2YIV3_9GENT
MEEGEEASLQWLPVEVIHHIFSYLNPEEKAQASILSKNWLFAWRKNPKLQFVDWDFYKPNWYPRNCCIYKNNPKKFRNYVNGILRKHQEDHIEEFNLSMNLTSDDLASLNGWLRIAIKKGVKVLDLSLCADMLSSPYSLPENILLEAKSLTELRLAGCKFINVMMCKNIRVLKLFNVYIDDETFRRVVEGCPFMDDLRIEECVGLDTIRIINLSSLKKLFIQRLRNIEVDAPTLEKMELSILRYPRFLELHASQNLKDLSLKKISIMGKSFFVDLMHKLPNLEYLEVKDCYVHGERVVNFTSHSLKHLCLSSISPSTKIQIEIDAPRLVVFQFQCETILPNVSFMASRSSVSSSQMVSRIEINHQSPRIGAWWFQDLNKLLSSLIGSKISIYITFWRLLQSLEHILGGSSNHPSCVAVDVEKLKLKMPYSFITTWTEDRTNDLVDCLFLACRPKTLVMHRIINRGDDFISYLLKLLTTAERIRNRDSCKSPDHDDIIKLWQDDLKEVVVEVKMKNGRKWRRLGPHDWKTNLLDDSLNFDEWTKIRFGLEWEVYSDSSKAKNHADVCFQA